MKKTSIKNIPEAQAYAVIPGTRYILLPDGVLAKPLTSTLKPSGPAYNIVIDGKVRRRHRRYC